MHQFTTKARVWIPDHSHHDADSLQRIINLSDVQVSTGNMADYGWTHVGEADVSVTIASPDMIVANKVSALRAALERDRIESQRRQNQLIAKINTLEALTFSEVTA